MRDRITINKFFAVVAISMGQKLKQLYDEIYKEDQSKTPEEVRDILEKLHVLDMLCEEIDKQYASSGAYLSILLAAAGGNAALYFRRYSEYLKELHRKGSKSKKIARNINDAKQKKRDLASYKVQPYLPHIHDHSKISKNQPPKNKIAENYLQDLQIAKHTSEYSLFNKYQHSKEGSVEYVKNDFMNHYDASKYQSLDEFLLERSHALHMSPAKYKEDLIHGQQSKMEALVNLIQPGWSEKPPPISDGDNTILNQPPKNRIAESYTQDQQIEKYISEYSLFNKYQDAKKDSVEYVKNDFMNHYESSKYQSLDEVLLERSKVLDMSPAKYKEDLIYGISSKMETLVNLIEPGWSKQPPPFSEDENTASKSK